MEKYVNNSIFNQNESQTQEKYTISKENSCINTISFSKTVTDNKINSTNSKAFVGELTTEEKRKLRLCNLSDSLILNILDFLTISEKINTIIFNRRLQLLTKIKLRHIKLKKFFFDLFNPNFCSKEICKFITENDNFANIFNKFKLMTELDIIRSLSLFLTDISETNKENNYFFTRFNDLINIEFAKKFITIHDIKKTRLIISIDEFYSPYFYSYLNKNQFLIDEIIISERSKNLNEIFNHNVYKYKMNKLKLTFGNNDDLSNIKGLNCLSEYFFNSKNSISSLEIIKEKKNEYYFKDESSKINPKKFKILLNNCNKKDEIKDFFKPSNTEEAQTKFNQKFLKWEKIELKGNGVVNKINAKKKEENEIICENNINKMNELYDIKKNQIFYQNKSKIEQSLQLHNIEKIKHLQKNNSNHTLLKNIYIDSNDNFTSKENNELNLVDLEDQNDKEFNKIIEQEYRLHSPIKKSNLIRNQDLSINDFSLNVPPLNNSVVFLKNSLSQESKIKNLSNNYQRQIRNYSKEEILNIIEYNSESLTCLKINVDFDDMAKFVKTLGRCRSLKILHLEFDTKVINKFLKNHSLFKSFITTLDLLRELKEFCTNPLIFIRNEIIDKLKTKKIIDMNLKFPSFIITDLNEKLGIVKSLINSFPQVTYLNLTLQYFELSNDCKLSYIEQNQTEDEKKTDKENNIIYKSNIQNKINFVNENTNDSYFEKNLKNSMKFNIENEYYKLKNEERNFEKLNNPLLHGDIEFISNKKLRDLILIEENEKLNKLDELLNNDNLKKNFFDIIFKNLNCLETIKITINGKKKKKIEKLNLDSFFNINNNKKAVIPNKNIMELEKNFQNKKISNIEVSEQNVNGLVKNNHHGTQIQEIQIKHQEEYKIQENQNNFRNESLIEGKNNTLFRFYTTAKGNHNIITMRDSFQYNQDIDNFCFVKNINQPTKLNYINSNYCNYLEEKLKKDEINKNQNMDKKFNFKNVFKNKSKNSIKNEKINKNASLGRKVLLDLKQNSALDILNDKNNIADLKKFISAPDVNKLLKSKSYELNLCKQYHSGISSFSNQLMENYQQYNNSDIFNLMPNNFSDDFYTEDNMNINFKYFGPHKNIRQSKKFTFLDKSNPSTFDRYSIKKYISNPSLRGLCENKYNENISNDGSFLKNKDLKNKFFSTKNNSIKIFTKIGNFENNNRAYSKRSINTPSLSVNFCRPKSLIPSQLRYSEDENIKLEKKISTTQSKIRSELMVNSNINSKSLNCKINRNEDNLANVLSTKLTPDLAEKEKNKNNNCNIINSLDILVNNNFNDKNPLQSEVKELKINNIEKINLSNQLENESENRKHKKHPSDISKIDINQIEEDIKKRDQENEMLKNFDLIFENDTKNFNTLIKKNSEFNKSSRSPSRPISNRPRSRMSNNNYSLLKTTNNKILNYKQEKLNVENWDALNGKKSGKDIRYNPEEVLFCQKIFYNLMDSLMVCKNLKFLEIEINMNIDQNLLSNNLYSFVNISKNIKKIKISTNCDKEEFTIKEKNDYFTESIFDFKSKKINEKILDSAKILITKNFSFFEPNNYYIIYKGDAKLFCDYFKSFKNLFFVNFLNELILQNDEIDIKFAYSIREILEKTLNLQIFQLKDLLLKCDFFEIIADKIQLNRQIRLILFEDLKEINEKSLNLFFKKLYTLNINFLVLERLDIGELFLTNLSQGKIKFPNLISFTFKPLKKLFHGISLLGDFFRINRSLYEFRMNITNVDDFYKLDEIITDFRFIKFELD